MTNDITPSATMGNGEKFSTLVARARQLAQSRPSETAFSFLRNGEAEGRKLTYRELDHHARCIAARLQEDGLVAKPLLLVYPAGIEFIAAFFGCMYAGAIAVPVNLPRAQQTLARLAAILGACRSSTVLTTTSLSTELAARFDRELPHQLLRWVATDDLPQNPSPRWEDSKISEDTIALFQYTSGSTGAPLGVSLTHANLMHNERAIAQAVQHGEAAKFLGWLPHYHDLGLASILHAVYVGVTYTLMSPVSFIQKPFRWLKAISDYRATASGAPNFAYDLCISKITPEQKSQLDLTCWRVAFNGAEPVRAETLERFAAAFAECGFRREAFYCCYGLAEATLMVSGGFLGNEARPVYIDKTALESNRAVQSQGPVKGAVKIASCGRPIVGHDVAIVDPDSSVRLAEGRVGEIWVSGRSVSGGYVNDPLKSAQVFGASLSGKGAGTYLRTGDLGFTLNGEVFITGRIKDLIIIRGQNYYPQDIEFTAERAHPGLATHANAAFTLEEQHQAYLVIVQELARGAATRWQLSEIAANISEAVANEHLLQAHCIVFIEPGSISKTTSGKIQRRACRQRYLDGTLPVIGQFRSGTMPIPATVSTHQAEFVAAIDTGTSTRLPRRPPGEGPESQ